MKEKRKKYVVLSIIIVVLLSIVLYRCVADGWIGNKIQRTNVKIYTFGKLKGAFKKDEGFNYYLERPIYRIEGIPIDRINVFTYEEREYIAMGRYVDEKFVECMLDDNYTVDVWRGEEVHLQIYKIKNISKDAAIVVKAKKEDVAYVYCNESYKADNLKEYLKGHGINENSEVQRIAISQKQKNKRGKGTKWEVQYHGTAVAEKVLEEMVVNGEQKISSDQIDRGTGLEIELIDESGVGKVRLTILCNGNIIAHGISGWTFKFENGIEWGAELIKELNEKEQGELTEY